MSYPYQQQPPYGQPPYGPQSGGYPVQPPMGRQGNPGLAIVAAILGVAVAGLLTFQNIDLLSEVPDGAEIPGEATTIIILHFVAAGIALLGAILVFARQIAGAFLLLGAGIVTIAVILLDPVIWEDTVGTMIDDVTDLSDISSTSATSAYYEVLFKFGHVQAILRALALVAALVVGILAALPPSLKWLRKPSAYGTGYPPPMW